MMLSSADICFKISLFLVVAFSKMIFREYQKSAKQFGSRSCPTFFIGPDLGPNCLQR